MRESGCSTGRATTGISPQRAVRQTEAARVLIVEHARFVGVANILLIVGDGLVQKVADLLGPRQRTRLRRSQRFRCGGDLLDPHLVRGKDPRRQRQERRLARRWPRA